MHAGEIGTLLFSTGNPQQVLSHTGHIVRKGPSALSRGIGKLLSRSRSRFLSQKNFHLGGIKLQNHAAVVGIPLDVGIADVRVVGFAFPDILREDFVGIAPGLFQSLSF